MHSDLIIRPYRIEDVFQIRVRDEQIEFHRSPRGLMDYAISIANGYMPITVTTIDNEIVLIGGLIPLYLDNAEGFFLLSDTFEHHYLKNALLLTKSIKKYIIRSPFNRIQTTVKQDFAKAEKFVKLLGLEKEGCLRKGGWDKKDLYIYGWVRNV